MVELEIEYGILAHISQSKEKVRQRDLAHIVGKSLGMTNVILQRLIKKGFLTVAKVNNRNLSYAVTPRGFYELSQRSFLFFKRTIKNVVVYKEAISRAVDAFVDTQPGQAIRVVLVGASDLAFIIEHVALKRNCKFEIVESLQNLKLGSQDTLLVLVSEDLDFEVEIRDYTCYWLRNIVEGHSNGGN